MNRNYKLSALIGAMVLWCGNALFYLNKGGKTFEEINSLRAPLVSVRQDHQQLLRWQDYLTEEGLQLLEGKGVELKGLEQKIEPELNRLRQESLKNLYRALFTLVGAYIIEKVK